ncbi:hypothetical protein EGJ22_12880, partial [Pseudomonas sp. p99-361]
AALDLTGAEDAPATLARNHRISHRYCTTFRAGAFPVGAGLPAIGPVQVYKDFSKIFELRW